MKSGQTHPAALLSKKLLVQALMELLGEMKYSDITITHLCKRADIARRTFYRNFTSIDDVLNYHVADVVEAFAQEMQKCETSDLKTTITVYFSYWAKQTELLTTLNRNQLTHILFTQYIKCQLRLPLPLCEKESSAASPRGFACKLAYVSGGLWSVLVYWITNGCTETPEELAAVICEV